MKPLLLCTICCFLACSSPVVLVDQDVSMLVSLEAARTFFPANGTVLNDNQLLPRAIFDALAPLTISDEPDALYAALSTVGIRLDACFTEGRAPQTCQPQVRLVLQPIFDSKDGLTTRDAAVHLFFSVPEPELLNAVGALARLRAELKLDLGTGIHAAHVGFSNEKWRQSAKAILTPMLQTNRIIRVTEMEVHAGNQAWTFSGFEVAGGKLTPIVISTVSPNTEGHVSSTAENTGLEISLDPPSVAEPNITSFLTPDRRQRMSTRDLQLASEALGRIEEPTAHNPGTIDCGSCHVATTAKWFLVHQMPTVSVNNEVQVSDVYADSRVQRAFGYFFQVPAISPRLMRETALARADFSRRLELQK